MYKSSHFSAHLPVRFQRIELDIAVSAVLLSLHVQRSVGGSRLTGRSWIARRGIRIWRHRHRRRRSWRRYRWRRRRGCVHPHMAIQRNLLVSAIRAVRTGVGFAHFKLAASGTGLAAAILIVIVCRVLVYAWSMSAIKSAMSIQGAGRAELDAARHTNQGGRRRRPCRLHCNRLLAVGWQDKQAARSDC